MFRLHTIALVEKSCQVGEKGTVGYFIMLKERTFLWVVFATLYLSRLRVFFVSWPFSLKSDAAIKADIVRIICGE
jgi:hypothetical protein